MNKGQLVLEIQKLLGKEATKACAETALNVVLDAIKAGVKKNKKITLVGFGTFSVVDRKARTGINPQTKEKIKIDKNSGQFYLPRSSLLRAGIDVRTAFGDPGFNGHLSFLLVNWTKSPFVIEKGARFAQLVNINTSDVDKEYDGDYNEN